ncbi:MAG: 30S ribosomal protein S2 [uncultured bacterium]|nr:MAG: 30S ribosomal protein S2 [uncultured bacterium]
MTQLPSLMDMLKAGMHFGHQKSRWHPKMEQYIFGVRNGVHILDLEKTTVELQKALDYTKGLAANGKTILFVGVKRQAQSIFKEAALECGMPFLTERWIGGLLTNFDEAKRRLKKYKTLQQQIASGEIEKYTKKEQIDIKKTVEKMDRYLAGLTNLDKLPDALFIVDMRVCKTAVAEAMRTGVPIIGICDTNVNPEQATYVIPANDDAVNSIKTIATLMAQAINEGKADWEKNKVVLEKESKRVEVKKVATDSETNSEPKSSTVKAAAARPVAKKQPRALTKESSI